jgi:hypothetical protein
MRLQLLRPSVAIAEGGSVPMARDWRQWLAEFLRLSDKIVPVGAICLFDPAVVDPTDTDQWDTGVGVGDWIGWAIADGTNSTVDMSGLAAAYSVTVAQRVG